MRKATLRGMLAKAGLGLRFNEHIEGDGPTVFAHACKLGLEGIVSKQKDSHAPPICVRSYQRTLGQRARARNSQASVRGIRASQRQSCHRGMPTYYCARRAQIGTLITYHVVTRTY